MFKQLLLVLLFFLVPQVTGGLVESVIQYFVSWFSPGILVAVISILMLLRYRKKSGINVLNADKDVMIRGIVFLWPNILNIVVTIIQYISGMRDVGKLTYSTFALAILAGVSEEIAFRAAPVMHMAKNFLTEKGIIKTAVFSSVLFGLIHMSNAGAGASIKLSIYQSILAACIGVLYVAVFLRTGSIVPTILMHFLNDFVAFFDAGSVKNGIITLSDFSYLEYIDAALTFLGLIFGIYLLRPAKRKDIIDLWTNKLCRVEINEESN